MAQPNTEVVPMIDTVRAYLKTKTLFRYCLMPLYRKAYGGAAYTRRQICRARLHSATISRQEFITDLRAAIENNAAYAAGKIGPSQQQWMYYEILLKGQTNSDEIKAFEENLIFHGLKQSGVFPADPSFYLLFNKLYMEHVRNLDCIGIFYYPRELELIGHYQLSNKLVHYMEQEPDRSSPSNDKRCYLQYFRNKKILLVCPFAGLLKQRATKEIFEGVWSKTGKRWFYPRSIDALEFPYGFSNEAQKSYATAIELLKEITTEIEKKNFDIALIAAAGLAIPIASYVKNMGKIGIDLGGHLQVLFGVIGKRWREREDWKMDYFNEWWIDMPANYRPKETDVCDQGAYW